MAPKMKLPQRRKSVRGLEENVRRKRLAAEPSATLISAPDPASASTQSPISPGKVPLSDRKGEPRKNIDSSLLKKKGSLLDQRLRTKDENFTAL